VGGRESGREDQCRDGGRRDRSGDDRRRSSRSAAPRSVLGTRHHRTDVSPATLTAPRRGYDHTTRWEAPASVWEARGRRNPAFRGLVFRSTRSRREGSRWAARPQARGGMGGRKATKAPTSKLYRSRFRGGGGGLEIHTRTKRPGRCSAAGGRPLLGAREAPVLEKLQAGGEGDAVSAAGACGARGKAQGTWSRNGSTTS